MDSLTHIVLGAAIGEMMLGKKIGKKGILWGAIANSLPDIDVLANFFTDPVNALLIHRGFTHSIFFAVVISPFLALLLYKRHIHSSASFIYWMSFFMVAIIAHDVIDVFTAYGTGLLEPFSHQRFSTNTIFVADPFYTLALLVSFIILLILKQNSDKRKVINYSASLSSRFKHEDNEDGFEYIYKEVKKTHTVRRGETLSELADRYNCTSGDIKKLNKLKSTKLRSGQRLKILAWVKTKQPSVNSENKATSSIKEESSAIIAGNETVTSANSDSVIKTETADSVTESAPAQENNGSDLKEEKYVYHLVQRGDTLWNIARRYEGATVDQIMQLNQITNNKNLKTGSKIKVMITG